MIAPRLESLTVGRSRAVRRIAVLRREGREPGLLWLGGFRSDMRGTKAEALDRWAGETGHACMRFDYSGHGESSGTFESGTISRWLDEAEAVLATLTGPQILVGSSMGGWIALLLAKRIRERIVDAGAEEDGPSIAGMVLLAPAVDMTETLMWDAFDDAARQSLREQGFYAEPSAYSDDPNIITWGLIRDGRRHLLPGPIETGCPVHVIQGMQDPDVPWQHATALMEKIALDDGILTLVRDGDHRLSRPQDIELITRAVADMVADTEEISAASHVPEAAQGTLDV